MSQKELSPDDIATIFAALGQSLEEWETIAVWGLIDILNMARDLMHKALIDTIAEKWPMN